MKHLKISKKKDNNKPLISNNNNNYEDIEFHCDEDYNFKVETKREKSKSPTNYPKLSKTKPSNLIKTDS